MQSHSQLLKPTQTIFSLASIMAVRMLALFMILPVFSLYIKKIPGATPFLIGVAMGIYGLTQAFFQIPFGSLSDRVGRKPIITLGLVLLALGSLIGALSHSIGGIIVGRALQGMGAVGSVTMALTADLTNDEYRSQAMAMMGLSIGFAFALAMVLGPLVNAWFQLAGVFWVSLLLSLLGILLLYTLIPKHQAMTHPNVETQTNKLKSILANSQLLRLQVGIFSIHGILTAMFVVLPLLLTQHLHLSQHQQSLLYLCILFLAFVFSFPIIIISEKKRIIKAILLLSIGLVIATQLLLAFSSSALWLISIILLLFFTGFTVLEALLPSLVSKLAPITAKGTAMGVFSCAQFLGIFFGGTLAGLLLNHFSPSSIFIFSSGLGIVWLLNAIPMQNPPYLSTLIYALPAATSPDSLNLFNQELRNLPGVAEVAIMLKEMLIYVKVDKQIADLTELRNKIEEISHGKRYQ